MTLAFPVEVAVKLTEQLPVMRVHVVGFVVPPVVPAATVKLTEPVGVLLETVVSATVAVHMED